MNPLILTVGVFLFVSGILLGRQSQSPSSKIFGFNTSTQQEQTPTETPTPNEKPIQTETPESTQTMPTPLSIKSTSTPKPTAANSQSINNVNLSDFKYPGSSVTSDTSSKLVLSSTDSPSSITSWYENRIKELGYSSRASAKTNTNGNVTNKLGGGKNNSSVNIEIVKKASEGSATITVTSGTDSGSDVHIKIENNEPYM